MESMVPVHDASVNQMASLGAVKVVLKLEGGGKAKAEFRILDGKGRRCYEEQTRWISLAFKHL